MQKLKIIFKNDSYQITNTLFGRYSLFNLLIFNIFKIKEIKVLK